SGNKLHIRHVGHLALFSIGYFDFGIVQKQSRSAAQFNVRFFVGRHGRDEVRFGGGQRRLVLQHKSAGRSAKGELFLLRTQRLFLEINGGLGGFDGGPILLHVELRV